MAVCLVITLIDHTFYLLWYVAAPEVIKTNPFAPELEFSLLPPSSSCQIDSDLINMDSSFSPQLLRFWQNEDEGGEHYKSGPGE